MAQAEARAAMGWTVADRRLMRRVTRRMVGAGLWRGAETGGFRPGSFVQIFCPQREGPSYEFGRTPNGRYVLIDRQTPAVSFHASLAAALSRVAAVPADPRRDRAAGR